MFYTLSIDPGPFSIIANHQNITSMKKIAQASDKEWDQMKSGWHPSRPSANPPYKDYNIGLTASWFTCRPLTFPTPAMNLKAGTFSLNGKVDWDERRKTLTYLAVIFVLETMIKTKIRITWNVSNPMRTVVVEQKHYSPKILTIRELEEYRDRYSEKLAGWIENRKGTLVGDGECWTLAANGLKAVGAMVSPGSWHGYLLFIFNRDQLIYTGGLKERGVVRGDIIQLFHGHFQTKEGRRKVAEPGHTSIIVKVDYRGILYVMEGNATPDKKVVEGEYDLREMIKGEVRIFRAVGKDWSGEELGEDLKW